MPILPFALRPTSLSNLSIGTDICSSNRVLRLLQGPHATRFIRRILRPEERAQAAHILSAVERWKIASRAKPLSKSTSLTSDHDADPSGLIQQSTKQQVKQRAEDPADRKDAMIASQAESKKTSLLDKRIAKYVRREMFNELASGQKVEGLEEYGTGTKKEDLRIFNAVVAKRVAQKRAEREETVPAGSAQELEVGKLRGVGSIMQAWEKSKMLKQQELDLTPEQDESTPRTRKPISPKQEAYNAYQANRKLLLGTAADLAATNPNARRTFQRQSRAPGRVAGTWGLESSEREAGRKAESGRREQPWKKGRAASLQTGLGVGDIASKRGFATASAPPEDAVGEEVDKGLKASAIADEDGALVIDNMEVDTPVSSSESTDPPTTSDISASESEAQHTTPEAEFDTAPSPLETDTLPLPKSPTPLSDHVPHTNPAAELATATIALKTAAQFLAGRFAAKEAIMKAIRSRKLSWHDIVILKPVGVSGGEGKEDEAGSVAPVAVVLAPVVVGLSSTFQENMVHYTRDEVVKVGEEIGKEGAATEAPEESLEDRFDGAQEVRISISHDGGFATAVCLAVDLGLENEGEERMRGVESLILAGAVKHEGG